MTYPFMLRRSTIAAAAALCVGLAVAAAWLFAPSEHETDQGWTRVESLDVHAGTIDTIEYGTLDFEHADQFAAISVGDCYRFHIVGSTIVDILGEIPCTST